MNFDNYSPPLTPPPTPPLIPYDPYAHASSIARFETLPGPEITDENLQRCLELFGDNYGIWGKTPGDEDDLKHGDTFISSLPTKLTWMSGTRVKISASELRKEFLSTPEDTILIVCNEQLNGGPWNWTGYAFVTAWNYEGGMWHAIF